MKMHEFFPENFTERVVILHNCPKGRQVTKPLSVGKSQVGNVGQKAVKKSNIKSIVSLSLRLASPFKDDNARFTTGILKNVVCSRMNIISMFLFIKTVHFLFRFICRVPTCLQVTMEKFSSQENDDIFPTFDQIKVSREPVLNRELPSLLVGYLGVLSL